MRIPGHASLLAMLTALPLMNAAVAAPLVLRVQVRTGSGAKIVELPLEKYVAATLAGESSVFQSSEALKAMAVAARTYAVRMRGRHSAEGFDLCDTTHCQRIDLKGVAPRLESAASETAGELLWFQGKPAFTPYTRDCGGRTEAASAVWPDLAAPYLTSHQDTYCTRVAHDTWQWNADPRQIEIALRQSELRSPQRLERVAITARTASGRASVLELSSGRESVHISASSFRFAVGRELGWNTIRGDRYEVHSSNGRLVFEGSGEGHGVGLCQRGAEQMGLSGRSYREILAYYYPGTTPGLTGRGLSWQRLRGDSISLFSTQPEQDRAALAAAERIARSLSQRTHWLLPANTEIRIYPDLDTFRDATGEPGWVAAHTTGHRIELQPVAVLASRAALESTLSHELLHVMMEAQAAPGLPVWFREGLIGYLQNAPRGAARVPADADLRQTEDADAARRAYADAVATVARLVDHYGETSMLDWVKRGLPSEVTNARASQATQKSK
jgi:stage II sporulation protein D